MKILAINGSPRKGNTEFLLGKLLEFLDDYEVINLREKKINFCGGGDTCCPVRKKCHIEDDMVDIYKKLEEADIIILASPSYFSNVTARMKNFMDRCNPYWFNKKLNGKKAFLIGTGGIGGQSIEEMLERMRTFVKILGMEEISSYYAKADKIGELEGNPNIIKEIEKVAEKLK